MLYGILALIAAAAIVAAVYYRGRATKIDDETASRIKYLEGEAYQLKESRDAARRERDDALKDAGEWRAEVLRLNAEVARLNEEVNKWQRDWSVETKVLEACRNNLKAFMLALTPLALQYGVTLDGPENVEEIKVKVDHQIQDWSNRLAAAIEAARALNERIAELEAQLTAPDQTAG